MRSALSTRLLWILVLSFTPLSQAMRPKLQRWFPKYEQFLIDAATSCQQEISNYQNGNKTLLCPAPCACAADCVLKDATSTMQSNFTSAQVLLGLLPTVLVFFGPTIAEVAALSTYQPLLAVLLALGSPAVHVSSLLGQVDIREPFVLSPSRNFRLWSAWLARQDVVIRILFRCLSYVGALAALANNVRNSVHTDLRTVSGWRCSALLHPLAWSTLAVGVHMWGMIAIRIRVQNGRPYSPSIKSVLQSDTFQQVFVVGDDSVVSEMLLWVASLSAIVHMVFGILELSSLLFISVPDAFEVFVAYAISAFMCRFVLLLELANMRHELCKNDSEEGSINDGETQGGGPDRAYSLTRI